MQPLAAPWRSSAPADSAGDSRMRPKTAAEENGYNAGRGSTSSTVNYPPQQRTPLTAPGHRGRGHRAASMRRAFSRSCCTAAPMMVTGRAVAVGDFNDTCVWALNPTIDKAVKVSGGATVDLPCGVFSNSNHVEGMATDGSGCLTATKRQGGRRLHRQLLQPRARSRRCTADQRPFRHDGGAGRCPPCTDNGNHRAKSTNSTAASSYSLSPQHLLRQHHRQFRRPPGTATRDLLFRSGGPYRSVRRCAWTGDGVYHLSSLRIPARATTSASPRPRRCHHVGAGL